MVMVNANGWRVEKVIRTFRGRVPAAVLRISWHGYWQADCLTTAQVAEYVELSTLVPEAPRKYARAEVKPPWRSADELLDVLVKATAQSRELGKARRPLIAHGGRCASSPTHVGFSSGKRLAP